MIKLSLKGSKRVFKIINIILLFFIFFFFLGASIRTLITGSIEGLFIYGITFIIIGWSLIKYIRTNVRGVHNYFIASFWFLIMVFSIIMTIVNAYLTFDNEIELMRKIAIFAENFETMPLIELERKLLKIGTVLWCSLIILFTSIVVLLGVIYFKYFFFYFREKIKDKSQWFFIFSNAILSFLGLVFINLFFVYEIFFNYVSAHFLFFLVNEEFSDEDELSIDETAGNLWVMFEDISIHFNSLNWNFFGIFMQILVFSFLIYISISKKFNFTKKQISQI